jgi:hypothetical protein
MKILPTGQLRRVVSGELAVCSERNCIDYFFFVGAAFAFLVAFFVAGGFAAWTG